MVYTYVIIVQTRYYKMLCIYMIAIRYGHMHKILFYIILNFSRTIKLL